jgi:hypothetical protein
VSLATPQEAPYTKGQAGTGLCFYLLYDKVYRADILAHAHAVSKQHGGAPGVDGVTFEDIEAAGLERWLAAVQEALRTETYRPQPVRRVLIPKPGGMGERTCACSGVTPVREPDAGKPHVRFDEEGRETRHGRLGEWTPDPKGRKRWGAAGPGHERARPSLYPVGATTTPALTL